MLHNLSRRASAERGVERRGDCHIARLQLVETPPSPHNIYNSARGSIVAFREWHVFCTVDPFFL